VLIVGRGGGTLEDLWAFNDERVARAIFASRVPVVSAVGHEIDFTIADLVADRRAPTPTAAASLVAPDRAELTQHTEHIARALRVATLRQVRRHRDRLSARIQRLRHPRQVLKGLQQRVDELGDRALRAMLGHLHASHLHLRGGAERLQALSPLGVLQRGYSIARRLDNGAVVRNAATLTPGDLLHLTFAAGSTHVRVEERGSE